jgi:peptidoglycan/LPS O-acetylase OafA/YrhL
VRGLAVLFVVLFHAGLPVTSGGVAGVTLFFVLSGYLIASLLMEEREATGTVDVSRFFIRRAWRLLPALVIVIVALLFLGALVGDIHVLAEDSFLTLAYFANWARATGDPMGLWNHAWSLSIEEQFYLVAPFALLAITRSRSPRSRVIIAAMALAVVVSVVWRATLIVNGASDGRVYFGTDTRMDALFAGCLLAAIRMRHPAWTPSRWLGPVALVTFAFLATLPLVNLAGPGSGYTLVTVASTAVVVGALRDDQRWTGLARRPLTWLGERSYSLYLVHVPVFMSLNVVLASAPAPLRVGTAVLVSQGLSAALFRYVEQPLRYGLRGRRAALGVRDDRTAEVPRGLRVGPEVPA